MARSTVALFGRAGGIATPGVGPTGPGRTNAMHVWNLRFIDDTNVEYPLSVGRGLVNLLCETNRVLGAGTW